MSVAAGCEGVMCGREPGLCCGCVGECTLGCGKFIWCSDGVSKGAACGGESGWGAGGVGGAFFKAERSEVVERKRAELTAGG